MALVYTPDGQAVVVPDAQASMFGAPQGNPLALGAGPMPIVNPMGEVPAGGAPDPQGVLPSVGANGMVPDPYAQPAPMPPPVEFKSKPVGAAPETSVGDVVNPFPKPSAAEAKQQAAQVKQAAQQGAYANSPEGRIAAGEGMALQANQQQQQTTQQLGDLTAEEMAATSAVKAAGQERADDTARNAANQDALNRKAVGDAQKKVGDAVDAEAKYKIDENRKWHNASTGAKVLAGISVALSGLGDVLNRRTGPNMALGIIQGAIKDDVEAQVREREHLGKRVGIARNSLDNYRQVAGDDREAGQLKVAEEYKRTAAQVEATASKYGSPKAKLNAKLLGDQLRADAAKIIGSAGESAYNREVKAKEMAMQKQQIGISAGQLALSRDQFKYGKERDARQEMIELAKLNQKADVGGLGGSAVPVLDAKGQPKLDANGAPVMTVEKLRNADGTLFNPADDVKKNLAAQRTGVQELYDVLSQVKEHREQYGGASSKTSPTAQAEYDRLINKAVFAWASANHLSTSDKESFDKARDAIFGADPSSYNISDVEGRINRSLQEEQNKYYNNLQGIGYTGQLPKFFDPSTIKKGQSVGEDEFQDLMSNSSGSSMGGRGIVNMLSNIGGGGAVVRARRAGESAAEAPELASQVQALSVMARSNNQTTRDLGWKRLAELSNNAKSPILQQLATSAIADLQTSDLPTETP